MRRLADLSTIRTLFNQGYNCAQIVFSEFAETLGLKREYCLKIATGFGAGMSMMKQACGAVSGAVMVIGAKYGNENENGKEKKLKTYDLVNEFAKQFTEKNKSISCPVLLDHDISTPEGLQKARELKLFETKCPQLVKDAIDILKELI